MDNKTLSAISAILSVVAAVLLLSVFVGVWNYSVGPTIFIASGVAGIAGAVTGFLARKSGASQLNSIGLWLGVLVVVGVGLSMGFYSFEEA
jgi:hypothetical protein